MRYKDKSIKFSSNLVPLIKNKSKTLTYRIGKKYDYLKKGDIVMFQESGKKGNGIFAEVEITDKYHKAFGELSHKAPGHEKFSSKEEMRNTYERYYKQEIKNDQEILVLGFTVIKLQ